MTVAPKESIISKIRHDIKSPLTAIIGYAEMISRIDISKETNGEKVKDYTEKIKKAAKDINDLVDSYKGL